MLLGVSMQFRKQFVSRQNLSLRKANLICSSIIEHNGMEEPKLTLSKEVLEKVRDPKNIAMGITGSPSSTLEVVIDITEQTKTDRTLGQMVYVSVEEDGHKILVIGQVIEIVTKNRWHEDPAFKGVIKRHGS